MNISHKGAVGRRVPVNTVLQVLQFQKFSQESPPAHLYRVVNNYRLITSTISLI